MGKMATNVDETQERVQDKPVNVVEEQDVEDGEEDMWSTDIVDALCSTDLSSLRESLLEKILNQKKMELMRTPEVMAWIAQRQAEVRNPSTTTPTASRHHPSTSSTPSPAASFNPSPNMHQTQFHQDPATETNRSEKGQEDSNERLNEEPSNAQHVNIQSQARNDFRKYSDSEGYRSNERTRRLASEDSRKYDRTFSGK